MAGVFTIARKELIDIVRSRRFLMLEGVLLLLLFVATYSSGSGGSFMGFITPRTPGGGQTSSFLRASGSGFQGIISFIGPILGIALAAGVITGEREKGTMKMLLSQPIFRDNVLNGKFLAIASTIVLATVLAYVFFMGVGIVALGVTPSMDEALRLLLITVFSTLYTLAFASIALLISVMFRRTTTAVIVALSVFVLFTFALSLISYPIAAAVIGPAPQATFVEQVVERRMPDGTVRNITTQVPSQGYREALSEYSQKQQGIMNTIQSISPNYHISRINTFLETLRNPSQSFSIGSSGSQTTSTTYSLAEGLQLLGVNIIALSLYLVIPFIASYITFTRQEEK